MRKDEDGFTPAASLRLDRATFDYLPEGYRNQSNTRNNALANELNRNVPRPFFLSHFESLRTSKSVLYQHLSTLGRFTSPTIPKHQLLREFPQMNGLFNNAVPTGKASTHPLEVNFQRRYELHFGRGRAFLHSGIAYALLRGWQMAATYEPFERVARGNAINSMNRSQMNPPDLNPVSTNFGRITSQTSSLNRMYQVQARIVF